jgi:hypothetical protein
MWGIIDFDEYSKWGGKSIFNVQSETYLRVQLYCLPTALHTLWCFGYAYVVESWALSLLPVDPKKVLTVLTSLSTIAWALSLLWVNPIEDSNHSRWRECYVSCRWIQHKIVIYSLTKKSSVTDLWVFVNQMLMNYPNNLGTLWCSRYAHG